jgi:hypothetical protein
MAFTDNFSGESVDTPLDTRTPSGGTAWSRVDTAVSNDPFVSSAGILNGNVTTTNRLYQCDDQSSADHYVQFVWKATAGIASFVANRATNQNNYFGVRVASTSGGQLQLIRNQSGLTTIGTYTIGSIPTDLTIRYEVEGDDHSVYLDGVLRIGPITDTFNNTETRQGIVGRNDGSALAWLDNFEAGPMAAPGTEALTGSASTGGQTAPSLTTSVPL